MWCFSTPFSPGFFCGIAWAGEGGTFFFIVPLLEYVNTEPPVFFSFVIIRRRDRRPTKRCVLYNGPAVQFQLPEQKFPTKQFVPFPQPPNAELGKGHAITARTQKGGGDRCLINSCHLYWRPMLAWHQDKGTSVAAL